jgi:thiamine pyrophosphate-dependent acetolactate synthase large subunit-like protein
MPAERIARLDALGAAVSRALARGGPALIEIVGDPAL